jgi:hypothetical protein
VSMCKRRRDISSSRALRGIRLAKCTTIWFNDRNFFADLTFLKREIALQKLPHRRELLQFFTIHYSHSMTDLWAGKRSIRPRMSFRSCPMANVSWLGSWTVVCESWLQRLS